MKFPSVEKVSPRWWTSAGDDYLLAARRCHLTDPQALLALVLNYVSYIFPVRRNRRLGDLAGRREIADLDGLKRCCPLVLSNRLVQPYPDACCCNDENNKSE